MGQTQNCCLSRREREEAVVLELPPAPEPEAVSAANVFYTWRNEATVSRMHRQFEADLKVHRRNWEEILTHADRMAYWQIKRQRQALLGVAEKWAQGVDAGLLHGSFKAWSAHRQKTAALLVQRQRLDGVLIKSSEADKDEMLRTIIKVWRGATVQGAELREKQDELTAMYRSWEEWVEEARLEAASSSWQPAAQAASSSWQPAAQATAEKFMRCGSCHEAVPAMEGMRDPTSKTWFCLPCWQVAADAYDLAVKAHEVLICQSCNKPVRDKEGAVEMAPGSFCCADCWRAFKASMPPPAPVPATQSPPPPPPPPPQSGPEANPISAQSGSAGSGEQSVQYQ